MIHWSVQKQTGGAAQPSKGLLQACGQGSKHLPAAAISDMAGTGWQAAEDPGVSQLLHQDDDTS